MKVISVLVGLISGVSIGSTAQATEFVVNGGFESWGLGSHPIGPFRSAEFSTQYAPGNGQLTGWSTTGLSFVIVPGNPDAIGRYGFFALHGPNNDSNNGLTASHQGGNFIAADSDRDFGAPITQLISGLTVGKTYRVSFEWAASQQLYFSGPTFDSWQVSLLDSANAVTANYQTETVNNPNHGFQPWRPEAFKFVAAETAQTLRFLADGPRGQPPFALLDNVSVTAAVPEPASWALMLAGFGLIGFAARRRSSAVAA